MKALILALFLAGACGEDALDFASDASRPDARRPSPAECGNGDPERGESCDDGNTVGGDGCSENCQSDETCGNGVRDPGEVCDDGNLRGGDGCAARCNSDERCGNRIVDVAVGELCDDGNDADGDGCASDCRSDEACGNGTLDRDEACDDGNTVDGDGCAARCGSEERCGNGVIDLTSSEACDDGNGVDGDGCDRNCRPSCVVDGNCENGDICDGIGTCESSRCVTSAARPDGTVCTSAGGAASVCRDQVCALSRCGDHIVDTLQLAELCDDGNTSSSDGCEATCVPTPRVAFVLETARMVFPRTYTAVEATCEDSTGRLTGSVREQNSLIVFDPLNMRLPGGEIAIYEAGTCDTTPDRRPRCSPIAGTPEASPPPVASTFRNESTSPCFVLDPADVPISVGAPEPVTAPCFVSAPVQFHLLGVPLEDARVHATYEGSDPPSLLTSGVIEGFITLEVARTAELTLGTVSVPLFPLFAAGAETASCSTEDHVVTETLSSGVTVSGFRAYFEFTASRVEWLETPRPL